MGLRLQPAWKVLLSSPRRCWGRGEGAAGCSGLYKLDPKGPTLHPPPQESKPALAALPLQLLTTRALGSWNRSRLPLYFYNLWALAQALCL